jgi:hypothetical protein
MRLEQMRDLYPRAASLIRRLADMRQIDTRAAEGLTEHALQRIESGQTSERDAVELLTARTRMVVRRG